MPFPSEVVTRVVTHQYLDPDSGQPCSGTVTFMPSSVLMYPGGTIIRTSIVGIIDGLTGNVSVEVPVNDSPAVNPVNTHYRLIEAVEEDGQQVWARTGDVRVPTGAGPINIDALIPVPTDDPGDAPTIRGPQGDPGPPGATYVHTQSTPAATWTINHPLNTIPNIVVILSGQTAPVITDIEYTSNNQVVLTFPSAVSGSAYLS